MERLESLAAFLDWQRELRAADDPQRKQVTICGGTGCTAFGARDLLEAFASAVEARGVGDRVSVKMTGCHGFCEKGPVLVVLPEKIFYPSVKPEDVDEILDTTVLGDKIVERLVYSDPVSGERIVYNPAVPFYAKQQRAVFRLNGVIHPTALHDYVAHGGYGALAQALGEMTPDEVLAEVRQAGLRGRGGAGFPTGVKWALCRQQPGDEKILICNADEGDPGAFMDRSLLEGVPHLVIEGMLLAAYAIGASQGFVYVRAEYPIAVEHTIEALAQTRERGLLGEGILGTAFTFDIEVRMGAGAFVCGEESALIASLEGHRGNPRPRPPFPVQKGYLGKPTTINNVETFANVPLIIADGWERYASVGTEGSKGTKIFALAGKVRNTGLVEVPMGATLRDIVFGIGGGVPEGREFKAAQMGGPSGGCVPAEFLDLPIDYDSVKQIGAIMGSGGLVVMDDQTCMVDVARFFLEFTQSESCGKCVPCRVGTRHMLDLLKRICAGEGQEADLDELDALAHEIKAGSLCGLGQTAPNPVLTTIRYFRDEYEAHIREHYCPAHVCAGLFAYRILAEVCTGCGACRKACPSGAITGERKQPHAIDQAKCVYCGACFEICPASAVTKQRATGGSDE
jgi:NADH:ubiquinone oxidoreductase subunit F (NADH-binding)/(2Fe-2S) ferredoxin